MTNLVRLLQKVYRLPLIQAAIFFVSPAQTQCRFQPTCSQYCVMAVHEHGVVRGGLKSIGRLVRCHPFSSGGLDLPTRL